MEADDTNPIVKEKVNGGIKFTQQILENSINKGIANGEFKPDWNASDFDTIIFAMLEGGNLISRTSGSNDKMKVIIRTLKEMIEEKSY